MLGMRERERTWKCSKESIQNKEQRKYSEKKWTRYQWHYQVVQHKCIIGVPENREKWKKSEDINNKTKRKPCTS